MKAKIKVEKEFDIKVLMVNANVRYWEDSEINGENDTENGENIPCKEGSSWKPVIDVETGQILNWEIGKNASIHYKVVDEGTYELVDEDNSVIVGIYQDYVPRAMCPKENGYGDYIIMDIDENGYIQDWKFSEYHLEDFICD